MDKAAKLKAAREARDRLEASARDLRERAKTAPDAERERLLTEADRHQDAAYAALTLMADLRARSS